MFGLGSGDLWGLFFGIVAILLPLSSHRLVKDWSALIAAEFCIFLHQTIAFTNAFITPTMGADKDAVRFHTYASKVAQGQATFEQLTIYPEFYEVVLSKVYGILGSSKLLGSQLSVFAFACSLLYFCALLRIQRVRYSAPLILLFGALPTSFLFGSVTLREAWQVLFFTMMVFHGLSFASRGGTLQISLTLFSGLALSMLHKGFSPFVLIALPLLLLYRIRQPSFTNWSQISLTRVIGLGLCVALIPALFIFHQSRDSSLIAGILAGSWIELLQGYQTGALNSAARTVFPVLMDPSSPSSLALTFIPALCFYLFSPFPWEIRSLLDAYGSFESLLRMALLFFALKRLVKSSSEERNFVVLLLILYSLTTLLWSFGTISYGTSIRHHMKNLWILILLGGPAFCETLAKLFRTHELRFCRQEGVSQ